MKAIELGERIEAARFLGREFLVFAWFLSEIGGGTVTIAGVGEVSLSLDTALVLERRADLVESTRLRGADPSAGREAKEALRDGKLPTRAHLVLARGEKVFSFHLVADTLGTTGVKIPQLLGEREDEAFFERMQLIAELEEMLDAFFADFLRARTSHLWETQLAPAMRRWVREEPTLTREQYEALRDAGASRAKKSR